MRFSGLIVGSQPPRRRPEQRRRTAGALAFAVLTAGILPTVGAQPAQARPGGKTPSIEIQAGYLELELDRTGTVVGLEDVRTGVDHLAPGHAASLVSLVVDGKQQRPTTVDRSGPGGQMLTFRNKAAHWKIQVKLVSSRGGYTTFEAVAVDAPKGVDVQTLLWGPLATSISQTVGTSVGVVRDDDFAIGLRPLTDRTEGAWPQEDQDMGWESEVDRNTDHVSVGSLEEWSAAGVTPGVPYCAPSPSTTRRNATARYAAIRSRSDRCPAATAGSPVPRSHSSEPRPRRRRRSCPTSRRARSCPTRS